MDTIQPVHQTMVMSCDRGSQENRLHKLFRARECLVPSSIHTMLGHSRVALSKMSWRGKSVRFMLGTDVMIVLLLGTHPYDSSNFSYLGAFRGQISGK